MFEDNKWHVHVEAIDRRTDNTMADGIMTTSFDIYVCNYHWFDASTRLVFPGGIIRPVDSVRHALLGIFLL